MFLYQIGSTKEWLLKSLIKYNQNPFFMPVSPKVPVVFVTVPPFLGLLRYLGDLNCNTFSFISVGEIIVPCGVFILYFQVGLEGDIGEVGEPGELLFRLVLALIGVLMLMGFLLLSSE